MENWTMQEIESFIIRILELEEKTPNDMELGKKVRTIVNEVIKKI